MIEQRGATRKVSYLNYLTLERTVCTFCFAQGKRTRIVTDDELIRGRANGRLAQYNRARKAAFRRHVASEHPEHAARIAWVGYGIR